MMEPVCTIWLQYHVRGLDVDINTDPKDRRAAVYAWVIDREIVYIGKAGGGLHRRMREHGRGFKTSARGKDHAVYLASQIERGRSIMLHAMWPEPVTVNGYLIPSHASVEDWLIEAADPLPVRNRKPKHISDCS